MLGLSYVSEICAAVALSGLGIYAGHKYSKIKSAWWTFGFYFPLAVLGLLILCGKLPYLQFVRPTAWLAQGRTPFAAIGFLAGMILTTPLSRVPRSSTRIGVRCLMVWIILQIAIWPFVEPAVIHARQASLSDVIDADGVCWQSTDYNCGPAAAVTQLRRLGISAHENEIAVAARTCASIGTPPQTLADALNKLYGASGIRCHYRAISNLKELCEAGPTLAVMKLGPLVDHYVAVLRCDENSVVVGDPLKGRVSLRAQDFQKSWRNLGIVILPTATDEPPNRHQY